ncbi:MAG: solute-binding protein [Anaerolineae bacterium]|nr:solute-binding protein [Anaerolineae bacterium]
MYTPRINWIIFSFFVLISVAVFVASLVSPLVRSYSYAPLRDLILPPPKPITLYVLYSTEKDAWIKEAIQIFEKTNPSYEGHPIKVEVKDMGSREMYLAVLDGKEKPVIISPASSLQISILQDLSASKFGTPLVEVSNRNSCRSVFSSPLVLVAWQERAQAIWSREPGKDVWQQIQKLATDPEGWGAYGHPEWGYFKFGHTNPLKSNSGFMTILLLTYGYFDKTSSLTTNDILGNKDFQSWFLGLEETISRFGESTGTYMRDIITYGPSVYDMVSVYEATAIEQADNAIGRYGELRVFYPPATVLSDHPFCILNAEWVSPQEASAAQIFIDFLLSEPIQNLALMRYGFRPAEKSIRLDQPGSPFVRYETNGLKTDLPPQVEIPAGNILNTLLDFWSRNINR